MKNFIGILLLLRYPVTWVIIGLVAIGCMLPKGGFQDFFAAITAGVIIIALVVGFISFVISVLKL